MGKCDIQHMLVAYIAIFCVFGIIGAVSMAVGYFSNLDDDPQYYAIPVCISSNYQDYYSVSSFPCPAPAALTSPQPVNVTLPFSGPNLGFLISNYTNKLTLSALNITGTAYPQNITFTFYELNWYTSYLTNIDVIGMDSFKSNCSSSSSKSCNFRFSSNPYRSGIYLGGDDYATGSNFTMAFDKFVLSGVKSSFNEEIAFFVQSYPNPSGRGRARALTPIEIAGVVFLSLAGAMIAIPLSLSPFGACFA
eukprot:TRINITY_DN5250_c0_g1_i1.p1 TRINITY_DN5250_c0_g1~~TRINITY_DN5250_c0_g1_i1.p1  ORF type:complete len:249 (-),score=12.89 TRINITY_DN5250_c0_g1_i1:79-825(-)